MIQISYILRHLHPSRWTYVLRLTPRRATVAETPGLSLRVPSLVYTLFERTKLPLPGNGKSLTQK